MLHLVQTCSTDLRGQMRTRLTGDDERMKVDVAVDESVAKAEDADNLMESLPLLVSIFVMSSLFP